MSATVAHQGRSRLSVRAVSLLLGLLVLLAVAAFVALSADEPDAPASGLDTTCGDFEQMTGKQRVDVIAESGHWKSDANAGVAYYLDACSPGDSDAQLKYFQG